MQQILPVKKVVGLGHRIKEGKKWNKEVGKILGDAVGGGLAFFKFGEMLKSLLFLT